MVTVDAGNLDQGAALNQTIPLNHVANVLILIYATDIFRISNPTGATCGGAACVLERTENFSTLWSIYRTAAANENIVITWSNAINHFSYVVSFTDTLTTNYFDSIASAHDLTGTSTLVTVTLPAGTAQRLIMQGIQTTSGLQPITLTDGQAWIVDYLINGGGECELASSNQEVLTASMPGGGVWWTIAVGIIDINQDLIWRKKRRSSLW